METLKKLVKKHLVDFAAFLEVFTLIIYGPVISINNLPCCNFALQSYPSFR